MARWSGAAGPIHTEAEPRATTDALETTRLELVGDPPAMAPPAVAGASSPRSSIVVGRFLGTVVVTVHGELDVARAAHLGRILADLIDGQGNLSVTVDLHDATASDADSLWVFTEAAERARRRGGTVTLNEPPAPLKKELQLRGVDHFVATMLE